MNQIKAVPPHSLNIECQNSSHLSSPGAGVVPADWVERVAPYAKPRMFPAMVQLFSTLVPLFVLLVGMFLALKVHYGLVLLLTIPTALFLVRTFIIMHDCGHGSFMPSRRGNDIVGFITGVLTLTPYVHWRKEHAVHHATSGNLDKRGVGDITTLTVREYQALSPWKRLQYRLYRNPLVMLGFGPLWIALKHRFPGPIKYFGAKERMSVYATDLVLGILIVLAAALGILGETLLLYLPAVLLAGALGIWLFYVQHQFEGAYWEHTESWRYATAALFGSTYLKLPRVLSWFTGNIGIHHIHHLSPKIPNYALRRCHEENAEFHAVPTIGLWEGIKALSLKLWDEDRKCMVTFREVAAV